MLVEIIDGEDIQWHRLGRDFNEYLKSRIREGSGFTRVKGEGIYAHCRECARAINKGKIRYIFDDPNGEISRCVDVPRGYEVREPALIVFEVTKDNAMHGWIRTLPQYFFSKQERREMEDIWYMSRNWHKGDARWHADQLQILKEDIYKRLLRRGSLETQRKARQIHEKYSALNSSK